MTPDLPAILGGTPVFAQPVGIVRLLPPLEAIYDRLEHAIPTAIPTPASRRGGG
jgi:hypothetical protein